MVYGRAIEGQVLNPVAFEALRELQEESGPDILAEIASMFEEDCANRLAILQVAVRDNRPNDVMRAAHALIGASSVIGAETMAMICRQVMASGKSGDLSDASALFTLLIEEYGRVQEALSREVARGK